MACTVLISHLISSTVLLLSSWEQSLEFIAEMRILAEMKIENRGTKYFPWKPPPPPPPQAYLFSVKIKMVDLWMQFEGSKLIIIVNFSVLDFFKFAFRMPQIAQILVSTFKIFRRERGGGEAPCPRTTPPPPPPPPWKFHLFFFHEQFQAL